MPKINPPKAPKKITVKAAPGRPKIIKVKREKPAIVVSTDTATTETLLPLKADISDLDRRVKKTGHVLNAFKDRMCRDGQDIDNLYLEKERLDRRLGVTMVVASCALLLGLIALIVAAV